MGKNIKRLSLALLALGLSAPVFADTGSPFAVTVPNQQGGFSFGANALYVKPSFTNTNYFNNVSVTTTSASSVTGSGSYQTVDPDWQWGFDAFVGYRLPGTGNDVTLTWTHICQKSNSDSFTSPATAVPTTIGASPLGNFSPFAGNTIPSIAAEGTSTFKYDAVDLDLGQKVNFGDQFLFKMFTGVRFASIEQDLDRTYATVFPAGSPVIDPAITSPVAVGYNVDQTSKFRGAGPRVGISGRYCFGNGCFGGFGLDANLAVSLLVGTTQSDADTTLATITTVAPVTTSYTSVSSDNDYKCHIVPAVDGNLGLDYTYNFNNCDRSSLVIQAGYRVVNYWNVTQFPHDHGSLFSDDTGLFASSDANNAGFHGPYLGVTVNL